MPFESSPLDATNKLEAHGVVDVETAGKQENKDYVYAVVHKENKGRDSVASFQARKPCSKQMEPAIRPNSAVESAKRLSSAPDPANQSDARCSSVEPLSGDEKKEYLYAVVDKANTKKRPPQVDMTETSFLLICFLGYYVFFRTRLPRLWPRFKSWNQCHKWIEFGVGSRPVPVGSRPGFPFSIEINISIFQFLRAGNSRSWVCHSYDCYFILSIYFVIFLCVCVCVCIIIQTLFLP